MVVHMHGQSQPRKPALIRHNEETSKPIHAPYNPFLAAWIKWRYGGGTHDRRLSTQRCTAFGHASLDHRQRFRRNYRHSPDTHAVLTSYA